MDDIEIQETNPKRMKRIGIKNILILYLVLVNDHNVIDICMKNLQNIIKIYLNA